MAKQITHINIHGSVLANNRNAAGGKTARSNQSDQVGNNCFRPAFERSGRNSRVTNVDLFWRVLTSDPAWACSWEFIKATGWMTVVLGPLSWKPAATGETMAVARQADVKPPQQRLDAWYLCQGVKWPGPPDETGDVNDGIGTAKNTAIGGQQFHFGQGLILRVTETRSDPGRLERNEMEPAPQKKKAGALNPSPA
jgi:hypothetical protein